MSAADQEKTVSFREFRRHLSLYLREAEQGGAIVVTSHGRQVARLGPPPVVKRPIAELLGAFKGKIQMAEDFDDTPVELIESMENDL